MNSTEKTSEQYTDMISFITKKLVKEPGSVKVEAIEGDLSVIIEVSVSKNDLGKIIGRNGRIARSLRTILQVATTSQNKRYALEILD